MLTHAVESRVNDVCYCCVIFWVFHAMRVVFWYVLVGEESGMWLTLGLFLCHIVAV
jgi:hypothetical protein